MYAVYNYAAGATTANILADVIKLLTGETNKANLSAACVQANTSITSTVSAGWTVHDAAAGTDYQVIKSLCADGTTYKYYGLKVDSATALRPLTYESWNATTHAATNSTAATSTYTPITIAPTGGGYLYIYCTNRNIMIRSYCSGAFQGVQGGFFHEYSREMVPTGYPCWLLSNGNGNGLYASPRVKNVTTTGDYLTGGSQFNLSHGISTACNSYLGGSGGTYVNNNGYYRDGSENVSLVVFKMEVFGIPIQNGTNLGTYRHGDVYDVVGMATVTGGTLDEIVINSKTYVLFGAFAYTDSSPGYFWQLVPKE